MAILRSLNDQWRPVHCSFKERFLVLQIDSRLSSISQLSPSTRQMLRISPYISMQLLLTNLSRANIFLILVYT